MDKDDRLEHAKPKPSQVEEIFTGKNVEEVVQRLYQKLMDVLHQESRSRYSNTTSFEPVDALILRLTNTCNESLREVIRSLQLYPDSLELNGPNTHGDFTLANRPWIEQDPVILLNNIQKGAKISSIETALLGRLGDHPNNVLQCMLQLCPRGDWPSHVRVLSSHEDPDVLKKDPRYYVVQTEYRQVSPMRIGQEARTGNKIFALLNKLDAMRSKDYDFLWLRTPPRHPWRLEIYKVAIIPTAYFNSFLYPPHFEPPANVLFDDLPEEYEFEYDEVRSLECLLSEKRQYQREDVEDVRRAIELYASKTDQAIYVDIAEIEGEDSRGVIVDIYAPKYLDV